MKENDKNVGTQLPTNPTPLLLRHIREFVYDDSRKLDGIIAYLTREFGGNVHDKGIVNVTGSSVEGNIHECLPSNVVDLETESYYLSSLHLPNAWICYDFKDLRVIPTSYSVRSYGACHLNLKSWVIEVSNTGTENSWTEIDSRENNNDLDSENATANFKIFHVPNESFRFFRLRQTGKNHAGFDSMMLTSLEIFGTLFEK